MGCTGAGRLMSCTGSKTEIIITDYCELLEYSVRLSVDTVQYTIQCLTSAFKSCPSLVHVRVLLYDLPL
jgi:hypothetical protein